MPIEPNGPAPYAPPSALLDFLSAVHDKDLPTPYTTEVVTRAGVTEGLAPRVLKTLKLFDLIDEEKEPTDRLLDLAKAGSDDYKERLADVLRAAYADIFQYVDPATTPIEKIQDQFRHYTPRGQRERMVTLFMGLCEFAGLAPPRERESKAAAGPEKQKAAKGGKGPARQHRPHKDPPPSRDSAKERYLAFLLKQAEEGDGTDPALLDRIERVLGVAAPPSPKPEGGGPD